MKHTGSCHCQEVRFAIETEGPIDGAMACNCSICQRKGHLLVFVQEAKFLLEAGEKSLGGYQFGKKSLHHMFCKICGVSTFSHGKGNDGNRMFAVNIRCLDNVEIENIQVQHYDGKSL